MKDTSETNAVPLIFLDPLTGHTPENGNGNEDEEDEENDEEEESESEEKKEVRTGSYALKLRDN